MKLSGCNEDELYDVVRALRMVFFDFDGVFTDNSVLVTEEGFELVRCSRFDGIGLRRLERTGVEPMILSTEVNPVVGVRSKKLKIACRQGCENKSAALRETLIERGVELCQVAFVGNDVNDLQCLEMVGLSIVVHDAHPDVLSAARLRTERLGGHGAVREVCDFVAGIRETAARPSRDPHAQALV